MTVVLMVVFTTSLGTMAGRIKYEKLKAGQNFDSINQWNVSGLNKDMVFSKATFIILSILSILVGLSVLSTNYVEKLVQDEENKKYLYIFGELGHSFASVIVCPSILIILNWSEIKKHLFLLIN